jgi:hypothetical protein
MALQSYRRNRSWPRDELISAPKVYTDIKLAVPAQGNLRS